MPDAPKISLCIIYYNEAHHIERCLESFRGAFDELCAVRATGSAIPDGTEDLIKNWCAANGIPLKGAEYLNAATAKDWPHADDFSAARNLAASLATSEYWFWCDADDVLREGDAPRIREGALLGADLVFWPYETGYGLCPLRERLVRKGTCFWMNALHEHIAEYADKVLIRKFQLNAVWLHRPILNAESANKKMERNKRILDAQLSNRPWLWHYYKQEDAFHQLRREPKRRLELLNEVFEHGKICLSYSAADPPFRFGIMMNFAEIAEQRHEAVRWMMDAFSMAPWRREPLALLALDAIEAGEGLAALGYAQSFMGKPRPTIDVQMFNHREPIYTWRGSQIYCRSLRAAGIEYAAKGQHDYAKQLNEAAVTRENAQFKQTNGKISLLHATRGRRNEPIQAYDAWHLTASHPESIEHIFVVDGDDPVGLKATTGFRRLVLPAGGGSVAAWNAAAEACTGEIMIQMSDDFMPPYAWDTAVIKRLGDLSRPSVLAVSDGIRADILCIAILTRARWLQQKDSPDGRNYLFHPGYKSVYSDDEFTCRAYFDNVVIEARDLVFQHNHPIARGVNNVREWDATYQAGNSQERYEAGKKLFDERNSGQQQALRKRREIEASRKATEFPAIVQNAPVQFYNPYRLGDCLWSLHWLRSVAKKYPDRKFEFGCKQEHLWQIVEVVEDLPNIRFSAEWNGINTWINADNLYPPKDKDQIAFLTRVFDRVAEKAGLENPLQKREDWLFDYPALDNPGLHCHWLLIDCPPLSGQMPKYNAKLAGEILRKLQCKYSVNAVTMEHPRAAVSLYGQYRPKNILMVATGPCWPTFNKWVEPNLIERIILLDEGSLKLNYGREWPHFASFEEAEAYMEFKGIL